MTIKDAILNNYSLSGKVALVTGASRGIGRASALLFASLGANVAVNGRNHELLAETAKEIETMDCESLILEGDISSSKNFPKEMVEKTIKKFGQIDILVNNAGIGIKKGFLEMDLNDWEQVININLTSAMLFCQAVLPYMIEKKYGKIVNVSSLVAKQARLSSAPCYGSSKAGMLYLTRHLAKEFGPYGIYVNAVCPGQIVAYMTRHWTEEHKKELISETPLRRLGYPDDVAKAILFLSSDLSSYVNGESLNVNGGYIMD